VTRRGTAKRESTLLSDSGRSERHIKPLLGGIAVRDLTRQDVETFMHEVAEGKTAACAKTGRRRGLSNVRGGKGVARRTVGLLGAIVGYGIEKGLRNDNPVHGVRKFAENRRKRRLTDAEYGKLGKALREIDHI
jgi:hypothetical protein